MNILRLYERLKQAEGLCLMPYQDHLGVWTIGYGATFWLGRKVDQSWGKISVKKAEAMLAAQMIWAIERASLSVSNFNTIGGTRQEALSEIVYQIGATGWLRFKRTRGYIERLNWECASEEFLDSTLACQTPNRAERYADMLEFGDKYEHLC